MAYIYTPLMKKVLHIAERERKPNVQHHSQADNLRARFESSEMGSVLSYGEATRPPAPSQVRFV